MILEQLIKYVFLFIILTNSVILYHQNKDNRNHNLIEFGKYSFSSLSNKFSNIPEIFFSINDITYSFSKKFGLIEIKYYLNLYNKDFHIIKPTDLSLLYNMGIFCNLYIFETNENIYSIANIHENKCFYCIEYTKINEHVKFGIKIYKINEFGEQIEFSELFFLQINYLILIKAKEFKIIINSILIIYIKSIKIYYRILTNIKKKEYF
jgi:hypothetical protein